MSPRLRIIVSGGAGLIAAFLVLASTGPRPELVVSTTVRRHGGPCLALEQWGVFGWVEVGRTDSMTEATGGDWSAPDDEAICHDVPDSPILVRLPPGAAPDSYRICGRADESGCLTIDVVPFRGTGPGP